MKTLQATLGLPAKVLHSVVVFVGDCTFKTDMPPNVLKGSGAVAGYNRQFTQPVLSEAQVQVAVGHLETRRLKPGYKTDREHVASLKARCNKPLKAAGSYSQLNYGESQSGSTEDQSDMLEEYRKN